MSNLATAENGDVRVVLEDIGEGHCGEYDKCDPDDEPLARFYVQRRTRDGWEDVEDASYCTLVPVATPSDTMVRLAQIILARVRGPILSGSSVKTLCETLSWIDPGWVHARDEH